METATAPAPTQSEAIEFPVAGGRRNTLSAKQQLTHNALVEFGFVGMGGARIPGKSHFIAEESINQCVTFPGNRGVVARRHLTDLKDTTLDLFLSKIEPSYRAQGLDIATLSPDGRPTTKIRIHGAESKIFWRDCSVSEKLMSANLGFVFVDEAWETPESFFLSIIPALGRAELADGTYAPARFLWASNPGPGWCKRYFPVGTVPSAWQIAVGNDILTCAYVPAFPRDNPFVPPGMETRMRAFYSEAWIRRYLEGDWSAFDGQVFTEFQRERHVLPYDVDLRETGWTHLLAMDWGYRSPAAALLVSIDYDGCFWFWDEYRHAQRTPAQHKPHLDLLAARVPYVHHWLMDPAAVSQADGVALWQQFNDLGLPFQTWSKRKHGPEGTVTFFKQLLANDLVRISPRCVGLIEEIELMEWEKQTPAAEMRANPAERMVDKDDHSIDAAFGVCECYRQQPGRPRDKGYKYEFEHLMDLAAVERRVIPGRAEFDAGGPRRGNGMRKLFGRR